LLLSVLGCRIAKHTTYEGLSLKKPPVQRISLQQGKAVNPESLKERRDTMPELVASFGNLRLTNEEGKSVFSVSNVSPTVSAETAAGFVDAVEKIYNNGQCTARVSIIMNLKR
jgi:hypothetical protein